MALLEIILFVAAFVGSATVFVLLIYCLIMIIVNGSRLIRSIRPETSLIKDLYFNPFNVLFRPKFLTPKGLEYRKAVLYWSGVLVLVGIAAFVLANYFDSH